jgi:hypothetical protein
MKICVLSNYAAYGNAAALAEGLKHFAEVVTVFRYRDEKGMDLQTKCLYGTNVPKCDHYIVIGAISISMLPKRCNGNVTAIMTDSTFMLSPEKFNKMFKSNGWRVWAMPDLAPLAHTENIYYQPFIIPKVDKRKTDLICHSPHNEAKELQKGTALIAAVCAKYNLPLTIIKGKTWRETIKIKAQHLFCVDQLVRGIGKSGLEGMLLDSVVISGVKPQGNNLPPIAWTDKKSFENDLIELIFDKQRQNEIIESQREWGKVNLDPKVMARKIIEKI